MARAPYKLPSVFVGCPYGGEFPFQEFKNTLDKIPFRWYYADTRLTTKHLLGVLTSYIKAVDFCIFDISLWNPNVALEIGLAEGLRVDYYILLNRSLTRGVPADIQGLQRIEYKSADGFDQDNLVPNLAKYLTRDYTHPRNIYNSLSGENRDRKFYVALAVLAHLRDNRRLSNSDMTHLCRGTYLRQDAQDEVLRVLEERGLIAGQHSRKGARLRKNLFPDILRVGR